MAILSGGVLLGIAFIFLWRGSQCDRLMCIESEDKKNWKLSEEYEHTPTSYRALFETKTGLLRIEKNSHLSFDDATLLVKVSIMKMQGLFDDARSPYPGAISDKISCDPSVRPEVRALHNATDTRTYYAGFLNSRLQLGSCIDTELLYRTNAMYMYCPSEQSVYHVEFITKKQTSDDTLYQSLLTGIRCRRRPPTFP